MLVCSVGSACDDYEVCLFRTEIGGKYGTFDGGGNAHSAYDNKPLSKEQAQVNVLKAIAFKLDEISQKLDAPNYSSGSQEFEYIGSASACVEEGEYYRRRQNLIVL